MSVQIFWGFGEGGSLPLVWEATELLKAGEDSVEAWSWVSHPVSAATTAPAANIPKRICFFTINPSLTKEK
jgi:hypothetical protein